MFDTEQWVKEYFMNVEKIKKIIEDGENLYKNSAPNAGLIKEGNQIGILSIIGLEAIFTTRELLVGPAVAFAASTMGQKGVELAFYQGGLYVGRFWAEDTVSAGYAKWDESLVDFYCASATGFGWGVYYKESVSFDKENPRMEIHVINSPNATTTLRILKTMQKDDPNLKVDTSRTFDQYSTGFQEAFFKLILKKQGFPDELLKNIRGREIQCQVQGASHCIIVVSQGEK